MTFRVPRGAVFLTVSAFLVVLLWLRCPTIITHARFWGEDGWVWYPTCYVQGWACLTVDHSGYLQTISMLVALASQAWPLAAAPTVFALVALLVQAAPAIFLLSSRMADAIPSRALRFGLALLLIAVPGMSEVYVNLTNAQWHLALLAFLILTASPAKRIGAALFDSAALLLAGLSGPFAVFLAPVAALWWLRYRGTWRLWRCVLVAGAAAIQLDLIIQHQHSRGDMASSIGVSLRAATNILVTDILGVATIGWRTLIDKFWDVSRGWLTLGSPAALTLATVLELAAALLTLRALWRGPWILRAFLLFVTIEFAASLTAGLRIDQTPLWQELEGMIGGRYFFHPILAWLAVVICLCADRAWPIRLLAVGLLAVTVVVAVPHDWSLRPLPPNAAFREEARHFAAAPAGTVMTFPVQPILSMTLTKR